jgi:flagellar protein FliS
MLYNALVKNILIAQNAVINKDLQKGHNSIIKAQDIIYEFICTLDMSYEVAKGMAAMYDYMLRRLKEANIKKDSEILEEVLGFAKELRDTWGQAMKIAKQQNASRDYKIAK